MVESRAPGPRARAAVARQAEDIEFVTALTQAISQRDRGSPREEALRIAEHTGQRSSGRVGRSASGRALNASAVDLAVIAHVRHVHTNYDELLMRGVDRSTARAQVWKKIESLIAK